MTPPPVTVTSGTPFILSEDAFVSISNVELNCITNKISLKPDTTVQTATTICGATDYPGATKWTLGLTLYQSFQDNGAYEVLSGALIDGVPVPYVIRFHAGAAGATNPEFTGEVVPRPFDIVDSDAGALVEIVLEWGCTGAPMEDFGTGPQPIGTNAKAGLTRTGSSSSTSSSTAASSSAA